MFIKTNDVSINLNMVQYFVKVDEKLIQIFFRCTIGDKKDDYVYLHRNSKEERDSLYNEINYALNAIHIGKE